MVRCESTFTCTHMNQGDSEVLSIVGDHYPIDGIVDHYKKIPLLMVNLNLRDCFSYEHLLRLLVLDMCCIATRSVTRVSFIGVLLQM